MKTPTLLLTVLTLASPVLAGDADTAAQDGGDKPAVVPSEDLATAGMIEGDEAEAETVSADLEAGAAHYKKNCRACHGPTAKGVSSYPKLAGQDIDVLTDLLERYRAGEKIGPNTMLMAPRAKKLTDEDIVNIVHWIASLE